MRPLLLGCRTWPGSKPALKASDFSRTAATRRSKALKQAGFSFVGPTTIYAFMRSMEFVNDHVAGCCVREDCDEARAAFARPGEA
jgi:DNA-3-methyladenine glycosylase I